MKSFHFLLVAMFNFLCKKGRKGKDNMELDYGFLKVTKHLERHDIVKLNVVVIIDL